MRDLLKREFSKGLARAKILDTDHTVLSHWILMQPMRQYVIDKIKAPMLKAIVALASKYPKPTRENVVKINTLTLLDIRDKFFEYEDNPGRKALFEAIWQIFIVEYEHDIYYRHRIDWVLEEITKSDWKPRPLGHPDKCWREPI